MNRNPSEIQAMTTLPLSHTCFGGRLGEQQNALRSALATAAKRAGFTDEYAEYQYLHNIPRTSLTVELVDALESHGYQITKKP